MTDWERDVGGNQLEEIGATLSDLLNRLGYQGD
jgi:hypothetical protein